MTIPVETYDWSSVPPAVAGQLRRYANYRLRPGHFVLALLEGRLYDAMRHAPDDCMTAFGPICLAIWRAMPADAVGSPNRVAAWLALGPAPVDGDQYVVHLQQYVEQLAEVVVSASSPEVAVRKALDDNPGVKAEWADGADAGKVKAWRVTDIDGNVVWESP